MNKILLSIILLGVVAVGQGSGRRFDHILTESNYGMPNIAVYHDNVTGQEFMCVYGGGYAALSCLSTGRNWK